MTLSFIIERFIFHNNRRNEEGMVIFDSLDKNIENEMNNSFFLENKDKSNIFHSILFSKDEYTNILQMSDLIGVGLNSAIYKSLNKYGYVNIDELPNFNPYLKIYWPLFEKNTNNNSVEGWGIKVWN